MDIDMTDTVPQFRIQWFHGRVSPTKQKSKAKQTSTPVIDIGDGNDLIPAKELAYQDAEDIPLAGNPGTQGVESGKCIRAC